MGMVMEMSMKNTSICFISNLIMRSAFIIRYLQPFYSNQKEMGNVNHHNITNMPSPRNYNQSNQFKLSKRMGPRDIPFLRVEPKSIEWENEDLIDGQGNWTQSSEVSEEEEVNQVSQKYQKSIIQEIKIKWNSFIKMKKKNYLEDYTVLKQIGRGGFGTVSKVKAKYTGVLRAAKKIKKASLAKGEHEKLFAEMAIMITLDHPNITRLFQVYDYKSSYVLVLQLCEGGQLFKKIVTKSLNQQISAIIIAQLLQALLYLHAKGIVHRDIKPQNMLFEKGTNSLKLIDFGIAIRHDGKQPLTARIGTPYYIAPQVLCKQYNQKCDLWSVGVILYMMISYRPPFNGDTETQVMENILKVEPSYKASSFKACSHDCLDILKKLLNKNPDQRPSALQAYSHPWIQKQLASQRIQNHQGAMDNISTFKFANRLQAVVFTYIVSQILTSEQKSTLKELFQQLDKNHDGVISSEELRQALLSRKQLSEDRINFLMRIIDTNGSGQIDFTEFIVAALQPHKLTSNHFEQAFAYFDIDHSGVITYDEIASFLENREYSQEEIKKIFKDVDENHDGQISKQEFCKVLTQKSKQRIDKIKREKAKKINKKASVKEKVEV